MKTMTIRHVPDEVRDELAARAARRGKSLQEYVLGELTQLAEKPSMEELMDGIRARKQQHPVHLSVEQILEHRDADRR